MTNKEIPKVTLDPETVHMLKTLQPTLHSLGKSSVLDKELHMRFFNTFREKGCSVIEFEWVEQFTFGIVAMRRFNKTFEEVVTLIEGGTRMMKWCYEECKKTSTPEPESDTNKMYGGDKTGMEMALLPLMAECGPAAQADHATAGLLFECLAVQGSQGTEDEQVEQAAWALVAIKKWGITMNEAHELVCKLSALEYCFQRYMKEGGDEFLFGETKPTIQ